MSKNKILFVSTFFSSARLRGGECFELRLTKMAMRRPADCEIALDAK